MIYDLSMLDDPDAVSERTLLDIDYAEKMHELYDFEGMEDFIHTYALLLLEACYVQRPAS